MLRRFAACALFIVCTSLLLPAVSGPADRQVTEPSSISSSSNPAAHPVPIEDLYYTRSVDGPTWSPDGKQIAFTTNMTGRLNLWRVDAEGGWPIQLSQSDDRQEAAAWSPDGKWIAYQQDKGGNELWDVYVVPANGGDAVNLTATPDVREEGPLWSHNGQTIAINYKTKQGTRYDVALLDLRSHAVRKLTNESSPNYSWTVLAWSGDDKTIYANRTDVGFTDGDVYAIDVATGKTENLTPHSGKIVNLASSLSPDGKSLLLTSNQKDGYQNVALLDVAARKLDWVTDTEWEARSGDFSPDGKLFTYVINQDGQSDGYLVDRASMHAQKVDLPPGLNEFAGNPRSFSPSGDRLLISHQSSVQTGDIWVYGVGNGTSKQLTFSAVASLTNTPIPPAQIVHYKSFDGKIISALLWMPFNLKRDGSNPALVLPHGGPTGQVTEYFSARTAALVSRGYICIAPNVRGSTGYGIAFQKANYQDLGGGDLQDEVYATKFLNATGYVNPKKIGITGGSYGGYMTLMALGKTPDVWAAGAELFGIIDWMTMLQHEDPELQEYEKSLLGDPVKDRKIYDAASPITFIHDYKAPLLVLQGENDPRVPKEEAEQVVDLLKKDGKTVAVHYYPNEGHGFAKRENQIDSIQRTVEWFDKYLKNQPSPGN